MRFVYAVDYLDYDDYRIDSLWTEPADAYRRFVEVKDDPARLGKYNVSAIPLDASIDDDPMTWQAEEDALLVGLRFNVYDVWAPIVRDEDGFVISE